MIKQLKMGFKLLPYTYGIISSTIFVIVMLVVGIAMEWSTTTLEVTGTDFNSLQNIGGYFILIVAMWPLQLLISLNVPNVVAASPWKKRIQTSVFSLTSGVCYLISYMIVVAVKLLKFSQGHLDETILVVELLAFPLLILLVNVYMAFSLKYFVASTIFFCIAMSLGMNMHGIAYYFGWFSVEGITPVMAVIVGLLSIAISMILTYGISCLIYKKPVSKYSQMNGLKKKM